MLISSWMFFWKSMLFRGLFRCFLILHQKGWREAPQNRAEQESFSDFEFVIVFGWMFFWKSILFRVHANFLLGVFLKINHVSKLFSIDAFYFYASNYSETGFMFRFWRHANFLLDISLKTNPASEAISRFFASKKVKIIAKN